MFRRVRGLFKLALPGSVPCLMYEFQVLRRFRTDLSSVTFGIHSCRGPYSGRGGKGTHLLFLVLLYPAHGHGQHHYQGRAGLELHLGKPAHEVVLGHQQKESSILDLDHIVSVICDRDSSH